MGIEDLLAVYIRKLMWEKNIMLGTIAKEIGYSRSSVTTFIRRHPGVKGTPPNVHLSKSLKMLKACGSSLTEFETWVNNPKEKKEFKYDQVNSLQ